MDQEFVKDMIWIIIQQLGTKEYKMMKTRAVHPSRSEVLDIFNEDVRVQFPKCNQGHQFEGIKGDFAK